MTEPTTGGDTTWLKTTPVKNSTHMIFSDVAEHILVPSTSR